ncbi:hypothetical protein [Endozoicomonas sp.]|uniref:hypothetical protein n=1 Tax=Endozoicomonas sp. TaxID=1892382 RepID=UPI00383A2C5B
MGKEIDQAVRLIIQWSKKPKWERFYHETRQLHLLPVCEELGKSEQQALSDINKGGFGDMLFGICLEDFLSRNWGPRQTNPVDDLLKYKGGKLSFTGKNYLRAIKDSALRLWDVVDIDPGEWLDVRDCLRPEDTFRVIEHSGSQSMQHGDIIGARVIKSGGGHRFTGGILMMPRLQALNIKDSIQAASEGLSRHELCGLIGSMWIRQVISPILPALFNTDGEEALFGTVYFRITEQIEAIETVLDRHREFSRDGDNPPAWTWLGEGSKTTTGREASVSGIVLSSQKNGRQCLGQIRLENERLTLDANGKNRVGQGVALIKSLVGDYLVGEPLIKYQTPEQLQQDQEASGSPSSSGPSLREELGDEEYGKIMSDFFDQHYQEVLDQLLPVLDNHSPREAVAEKQLLPKLIVWLRHVDSAEADRADREGLPVYDTQWIWDELGVTGR